MAGADSRGGDQAPWHPSGALNVGPERVPYISYSLKLRWKYIKITLKNGQLYPIVFFSEGDQKTMRERIHQKPDFFSHVSNSGFPWKNPVSTHVHGGNFNSLFLIKSFSDTKYKDTATIRSDALMYRVPSRYGFKLLHTYNSYCEFMHSLCAHLNVILTVPIQTKVHWLQ